MTSCTQISALGTTPDGTVPAVYGWRHSAPCGCFVLEGIRLDKQEPILAAAPCETPGHRERIDALYADILSDAEGDATPLHNVVEERFSMFYAEEVA